MYGVPRAAKLLPSRVLPRSRLLIKLPGEPDEEGGGDEVEGSRGEGIGDAARTAEEHSPDAIFDRDSCGQPPLMKYASRELEPRSPPGLRGLSPLQQHPFWRTVSFCELLHER